MNIETLLKIIEASLALWKSKLPGEVGGAVDVALELEKLLQAGHQAYVEQVGKPLDPDLIKPA